MPPPFHKYFWWRHIQSNEITETDDDLLDSFWFRAASPESLNVGLVDPTGKTTDKTTENDWQHRVGMPGIGAGTTIGIAMYQTKRK